LQQPALTFVSLKKAFEELLKHELEVSDSINELVDIGAIDIKSITNSTLTSQTFMFFC